MINSPQYSLRNCDFNELAETLFSVGHVVLLDVWNIHYLEKVKELIKRKFSIDDERFSNGFGDAQKSTIDAYLGGTTDMPSLIGTYPEQQTADEEFFCEVDRSGLPALYKFLLNGNFMVGRSERVVRRFDPNFPMGFVQLHNDYQFDVCRTRGFNSNESFTLWTPLQNCTDDDISRLLLLHRGETDIGLTAKQVRFESQEIEYLKRDSAKVDAYMQRVFTERRCYTPKVALGASILFLHDVVHGTFIPKGAMKYRYSMDFRVVGEYELNKENAYLSGLLYRSETFPPITSPSLLSRLTRKIMRSVS